MILLVSTSLKLNITDLLKKTCMNGAKSIPTLMFFGNKLSLSQGEPFKDPSLYHSTIGALQYLTMIRLNISPAVNKLSEFYMLQPLIIGRLAKESLNIFMTQLAMAYISNQLKVYFLKGLHMQIGL